MAEAGNDIPRQGNRFKRHPWLSRALLLLVLLLLSEGALRLAAQAGLYPYQMYPTSFNPVYWDDIDPHFGVWHHPHASLRHQSSCFDVTYTSNSHGARDRERGESTGGRPRVVVLGDSYVEGYGNPLEQRCSEILEKKMSMEFLNFGTSGNFGSIQEWQLYEHLARRFEHTAVVLLLLPFNDFSDNRATDFPRERYRPYLRNNSGHYELYYTVDFEKRRRDFRKLSTIVKNTIDNHVYVANFLRWAVRLLKKKEGAAPPDHGLPEQAPYMSYAAEDMAQLLYSYEKILALAGGLPLHVFSIPSSLDYQAYAAGRRQFPLQCDMAQFAGVHPHFYFHDLLPDFYAYLQAHDLHYGDLTLGCDEHWGALGHQLAAESIQRELLR